jgi:hypothetical protein
VGPAATLHQHAADPDRSRGEPATEQQTGASRPLATSTWLWAPLLGLSLLLAAYTGFRMPNLYSTTFYETSLVDGFHRRFLVGTLLRPFSQLTNYDYYLYAGVAFAILAALLTVMVVMGLRAPLASQRFLVVAFLLLPTGGFLFHEVGYLDQFLYLLLFGSIWLLRRSAWLPATLLMALAIASHEIAVLTVLPIFAFVAFRQLGWQRTMAALTVPGAVALILFATPQLDPGAIARLSETLRVSNFSARSDAFAVFTRSLSQTWSLPWYSVHDVFLFLLPFFLLTTGAFAVLYWTSRQGFATGERGLDFVFGVLAVGSPLLLAFAGWDQYRWAFLLMANFFVVVWIWLGDRGRELDLAHWVVLAVVLLATLHGSLEYFDGFAPRSVRPQDIGHFGQSVVDGTLFKIPPR